MDERNLVGRAPWWFRKLVVAETAEFARRRETDPMYGRRLMNPRTDGADPVHPKFEGDELTLEQKLAKYGIVKEPGDEEASDRLAKAKIPEYNPGFAPGALRDPEEW